MRSKMADKQFNHSDQPTCYNGKVPHHFFPQINLNHPILIPFFHFS
uniref:Uncharacterized protein n=1 Tax=Manihot esculenta TaxID=3983 RepID=A0A2C9VXV1_MANES